MLAGNTEKRVSERVLACVYSVSNALGAGFLESVYENALCIEFSAQGIPFQRQQRFNVRYRDEIVGDYIADLVIQNRLLVELKAVSRMTTEHEAQVMNHLRVSGLNVGLLVNLGTPRVGVRRIVWCHDDSQEI